MTSTIGTAPPLEPRGGRSVWMSAFALATLLHVSAAAFAIGAQPKNEELTAEDLGGLVVVEFAPIVATAERQEESAAPSEESATSAPSPEVEQQKSAAQEDDTPTTESSPHEAPPDLQLAQQKTIEKQENEQEAQPTEANEATPAPAPAAAAAASTEAAPPAVDESPATEAPTEGSTAKAEEAPASWRRAVVAHLGKHKRYPARARSQANQGEVAVRFRIDRAGKVLSASVLRSSGSPALDAAALDLLKRAEPLPAFPASMRGAEIELVAPINFRLK